MSSRFNRGLGALILSGVALASCRSILDVEPGTLADDAKGGTGGNAGSGGSAGRGGEAGSSSGSAGTSGRGGSAGTSGTGGSSGTGNVGGVGGTGNAGGGGTGAVAGSGGGGTGATGGTEGGTPGLSPAGICEACVNRHCESQLDACENDAPCSAGVPAWLACTSEVATSCVTAPDGSVLRDMQACGAAACDVCRHLTNGKPAIEILTPSNGTTLAKEDYVQVSVRVHNFKVAGIGICTPTEVNCGHIHLNLDEQTCRTGPWFNQVVYAVDANGDADSAVSTMLCPSIVGRTVKLRASLSSNTNHADRVPYVGAEIDVTFTEQ